MNAREELVKEAGDRTVAYGRITLGDEKWNEATKVVAFGSHEEYLAALPRLDFDYDEGFGGQNLFGFVVFDDGTWLERGEYDGSEWWAHKRMPERPPVEKPA